MRAVSLALAAVIGLAAGAVAAAPAATAHPSCSVHPYGRVASLNTADNGRTICVHRGQRIDVKLVVDPVDGTVPEQWWQPVELSGTGLTVLPMTLMAMRGTTLAYYRASAHGRATLASVRRLCAPPQPGGASCQAFETWSVDVVVR